MFRRSPTAKDDADGTRAPRARGPKVLKIHVSGVDHTIADHFTSRIIIWPSSQLSTKLSDLGDKVRRIRVSPSQPNLGSYSSTTSASELPPLPPLRGPPTPVSPSSNAAGSSSPAVTSPSQYYLSPISALEGDSFLLPSVGTPPTAPDEPRTLLQSRSMGSVASSPKSSRLENPIPTDAPTVNVPVSPVTPERKKPTTRSAILARKKSEAEAGSSAIPESLLPTLDSAPTLQSLTRGLSVDTSSLTVSAPPGTSVTPATPSPPLPRHSNSLKRTSAISEQSQSQSSNSSQQQPKLFTRNYTLSTASVPSFATTESLGSNIAGPSSYHPHPHSQQPPASSSSFAASSESFRRFDSVPETPPVPPIPEKYQYRSPPGSSNIPSGSRAKLSLDSVKPPSISTPVPAPAPAPALPAIPAVELSIAVIGAKGCGKSEFIWKGMKVWGLGSGSGSAVVSEQTACGVLIQKRVALPGSTSASASTHGHGAGAGSMSSVGTAGLSSRLFEADRTAGEDADGGDDGGDDTASTLYERRRVGKVTLYEVDSASLLLLRRRASAPSAPSAPEGSNSDAHGRGARAEADWVWPEQDMPPIDAVMICYDAGDGTSVDGVEDICAALQAREIPAVLVECKKDLLDAPAPADGSARTTVSTDVMAVKMRRFGMGLVETSVKTEVGKRTARAAFKWIIRSMLRAQGAPTSNRISGQRWRNPASPDVLRALPWESGDADVFSSSETPRATSPLPATTPRPLGPAWSDARDGRTSIASASAGAVPMARSASSPDTQSRPPTPPPKASEEIPVYLRAVPYVLGPAPERNDVENRLVRQDLSALLRGQPVSAEARRKSEVGAPFSASVLATPTRRRTLRSSQTTSPPSMPSMTSVLKKGMSDSPEPAFTASSSRRGSLAPSNPSSGGNANIIGPSRAKSTPEFASRVRFQLNEDAPAVPDVPTPRARGNSGNATAGPSSLRHAPPSAYSPPRASHARNESLGPPILPPLDIPTAASFEGAAEDIISSAAASMRYQEAKEEEDRQSQRKMTAGSSDAMGESPQAMTREDEAARKGSLQHKLKTMDSSALIEYEIRKAEKKKNPHGDKPILVTIKELLDEVVKTAFHDIHAPLIDTFLASLRSIATPRVVIDGLHRRIRIIEKKVAYAPAAYHMQFGVCRFLQRWILEHPTDFGSKVANDEMMKLLDWMRTKCHLLHYCDRLTPLTRAAAQLEEDPDCLYAVVDPLAKPWQAVDDALLAKGATPQDGSARSLQSRHAPEAPALSDKTKLKFLMSSATRRRLQEAEEASLTEKLVKERLAATSFDPLTLINRAVKDGVPSRAVALSPVGPTYDTQLAENTARRQVELLFKSPKVAREEEKAAARQLGTVRYLARMVRQPVLDAIRLRAPPVYNYTPLAIVDSTTRRDIVENLQKAANVVQMMDARQIAEEITNVMRISFLNIQPRDWLRHASKPRPQYTDDEPDYVPKRIPVWIPVHDDIDEINTVFNQLAFWTSSLIVAPDAFSERRRVIIHMIQVAQELRRHNNYFASHAVQVGVRSTLFEGDLLYEKVEDDPLYKVLRSLENLYSTGGAHASYRLGLKVTQGPAIPDLSVHVVDFNRWVNAPNFALDNSGRVNWGKIVKQYADISQLAHFQRKFHDVDSHDFIIRAKVRKVILEMPVMPDVILHSRTVPIDPRDGSEHPSRERIKRFFGVKPTGPAFNPSYPYIPTLTLDSNKEERFPLK